MNSDLRHEHERNLAELQPPAGTGYRAPIRRRDRRVRIRRVDVDPQATAVLFAALRI